MKRIFMAILVAALLSACTTVPETVVTQRNGKFVEYEVHVVPKSGKPIYIPGNAGCTRGNGNKDGCIRFAQGDYGVIVFSVGGKGRSNRTCSDNGVQWVITEIRITDTGSLDTGKGSNFGTPVVPWVTAAIFPFDDPTKGTLYKRNQKSGDTRVGVINLNNNLATDPKDLWYEITATNCRDETDTSTTDPRIENEGR